MKPKTDLHQSLSALTVEEFEANPPKAIRPLTPSVECGECERLRAENYELKSYLITLAGRLEYISDHTDWTRAELLEWIKEIDVLVGIR